MTSKGPSSAVALDLKIIDDGPRSRETAIRAINDLLSRYVGQLLHGCGSSECTEVLCRTGRLNTSSRPLRRYTPRSARAIALTVATGPKPRARLCPRYRHQNQHSDDGDAERGLEDEKNPQDASSIVQRLHDTSAIKQLCEPSAKVRELQIFAKDVRAVEHRRNAFIDFAHSLFNNWAKPHDSASIESAACMFHEQTQILLHISMPPGLTPRALNWTSGLVGDNMATTAMLNTRPGQREQQRILDAMNHQPSCNLLRRVARGMGSYAGRKQSPSDRVVPTPMMQTFCQLFFQKGWHQTSDDSLVRAKYLCVWLKKIFLMQWDGGCFVNDEDAHIPCLLICLVNTLSLHKSASEEDAVFLPVFGNLLSHLDVRQLALTWLSDTNPGGPTHLLYFRQVFPDRYRFICFRTINHIRMQKAHDIAAKVVEIRHRMDPDMSDINPVGRLRYLEEHYLLLSVRRGHLVQDAFDQLWQRRKGELSRPLRVRLGEHDMFELGQDLGGVQIEFFNLICKELFREDAQLFATNPTTGYSYFQPASLQPLYMFETVGILFGLAIYNGVTLPVSLPRAFYQSLFDIPLDDPAQLYDYWPAMSNSLSTILRDDVGYIEATFPLEANGLRLDVLRLESLHPPSAPFSTPLPTAMRIISATPILHEGDGQGVKAEDPEQEPKTIPTQTTRSIIASSAHSWPGWYLMHTSEEPEEVTAENKKAYVLQYIQWLTTLSIQPQLDAFKKGFFSVMDHRTVTTLFSPHEFYTLVEGIQYLNLDELRRHTTYEGYDETDEYIQTFWAVVESWPQEKQKDLVKFVTAAERIPVAGAGQLAFRIRSNGRSDSRGGLPRSSTCFRTLMLPRYESRELLDEKLSLAVTYGMEGFGTI